MKLPVSCESLSGMRPVQLIGGEQTLFAVTADGKVGNSPSTLFRLFNVGAVPPPPPTQAYRAHTKRPVVCTHYGFNKEIQAYSIPSLSYAYLWNSPIVSSADILANSLNPDQARQNVGPDLDPNCLTL